MAHKSIFKAMVDHKQKISGPHFLFSADNPKFPENNKLGLNHEQVLHHLKGAGYDAHEVKGHYGAPERSIAIYGVTPEHAEKLHGMAAQLGQDSSIYSSGKDHEMLFHHGDQKGKKVTGQGTNWHQQKPNDFYTSLPGGVHHFTHNFNFDKSEERQKLTHFSGQADLKEIDPKFKGTGVDARTRGRDSEHPHSFYYRHGTEPEDVVVGQSSHKYSTSYHPKEQPIYDIGADEHKMVEQVKQANNGVFNMDMLHQKIKEKGYHGFHNTKHPSLKNVVVMYNPLKVEGYEKIK